MRIKISDKPFKSIAAYYIRHAASAGIALLILSTALLAVHLLFNMESNAPLIIGFVIMAIGMATTIKAMSIRR